MSLEQWTNRLIAALIVACMLVLPQMLSTSDADLVCDEVDDRSGSESMEEEVKLACAIYEWTYPMNEDKRTVHCHPIFDELIESAMHGDVTVPPPKWA